MVHFRKGKAGSVVSNLAVVALSAGLLGATIAQAAPIASDSFWTTTNGSGGTYSIAFGSNTGRIHGQNPSAGLSGFTGAWGNSGSTTTSDLRAQLTGLSHALVTGSTQPGSATSAGGTATRGVYREISTIPASSTYYFSFLMNSAGNRTATLGLREQGAHDTSVSNTSIGGVSVGFSGTGISAWVNGTATQIMSSFNANETYFALVEILNNGAGVNDTINVKLYASSNTDLNSPTASASITNRDVTGRFTHLALIKLTGDTDVHASLDEFRFSTQLSEVVVPEPAALGLIGLVGMGLLARRRRGV
jgi:hypothetical protein